MRIVFLGLPLAALLLLRDGHDIAFAALSRPLAVGTRRLTRALGAASVAHKPDMTRDAFAERVRAARPDLIVSWFWTTRLPTRVIEIAKLGAVGVHPSLLPRHRGPDPFFWAIDAGDVETGVTAHRLDERYDTGAILGQAKLAIDPTWSAWTLARKLDRPSLALLRRVVRGFADGHPPTAMAQDESFATYAPEPDDDALAIRWHDDAARIVRRVRAASPWPGAFTEVGDAMVTLTRARETRELPRALAPGEAAVRADGVAVVRARDAGVELLEGRDEDDGPLDTDALAALVRASRKEGPPS